MWSGGSGPGIEPFLGGRLHTALTATLTTTPPLRSNLNDANSEAETLSRSAFTDPLTKCCEFFDTLVDTDQKEFLRDQMLCEAAAGCLEHDSADDITATLHNLLWGLSHQKSRLRRSAAL